MNAFHRTSAAASVLIFAFSVFGCSEKPTVVADDAGAAATTQPKTVLGGKLGAAVAAAESSAKVPSPSSSAAAGGPPESGVFTSAAADAALPPGAPAKVELLGEGSDPKVAIAIAPKGDEQKATISVSVRIAQIAMALDFGFNFKIEKPKGDKDKGDAPVRVVASVTSVAPGKEMLGQIPKELGDAIGKLKGSEVRYQLAPSGAMSEVVTSLGKDVDRNGPVFPLMEVLMRQAGEALSLLSVVVPSKPVGVGAYWMVTERAGAYPVEVIRYRVFKVDKIEKDHASLSVDVRQYASKSQADLGAIAKGEKLDVDGFESQGKGDSVWQAGLMLAPGCQVDVRTQATSGGVKNGQTKGLQTELAARSMASDKSDKKN